MLTQKRWLLLFIILLAFALRVFHLDTQSIWYDEGLSIQLAQQDPAQAIALSATTDHPPLHTLLLGGWMRVAGASDFVVRYLSVFCGILVVVLTYVLGKRYDERTGLIAAGLMALAPLAIYYSQETRGYMLLTALILTSILAVLRLLNDDRRKRVWFTYIAAMALALYTHYFAAFAWAAINVGWGIVWFMTSDHTKTGQGEGRFRLFASWILAQLIVLTCFLPWIPNALAQAGSNATYFPGRVTWNTVFADTWRAFSVGEWGDMSLVGWLWLAVILLGGFAGLALNLKRGGLNKTEPFRQRSRLAVIVLAIALILISLLMMSGLAWLKPKFAPRYLLPSLPAFITLAAIGVTILLDGMRTRYCRWASIGVVITLALPLASIGSLLQLYTDPTLARPDVRSVVRYIENSELPTDAILLIGGHQAPAFDHYYRGQAAVIPLPPDLLPAAQAPLDARSLSQLRSIVQQHPRVWLVMWQNQISDPTNLIEDSLVATSKRINVGANFHDMGLLLFDTSEANIVDAPQYPLDAAFSDPVRAVGYNVNSRRNPIDTPLRFGLYLKSEGPITHNYQIFTHLVAEDGTLVAQADHIAGADSYPTSLWQPGNLLYNHFEIQPPAGTPPGEYHVIVGLYDERGRLKLSDGRDQIDLFTVTLTP
ncbi:MAG TPA: glycosyltransferase family 39 protein [Anaerolineae bacterium]|nr:glycosyltransferase family 39 protein [Anaerolineae bacterium]